MRQAIDAWLRLAAGRIHEEAAALTALDAAIGDGDHGTNMDRGFAAIVAMMDAIPASPSSRDAAAAGAAAGAAATADATADAADVAAAAALLKDAGRRLISTVGGAAGPLYGTAFLKASAAVDKSVDLDGPAVFVAALEAAIGGIASLGKSHAGEKTMLDALMPALDAARDAARAGTSSAVVLAAADAADRGAEATIPMLATKGRASYLGPRSVGHKDPGATSAALLMRALADTLAG